MRKIKNMFKEYAEKGVTKAYQNDFKFRTSIQRKLRT